MAEGLARSCPLTHGSQREYSIASLFVALLVLVFNVSHLPELCAYFSKGFTLREKSMLDWEPQVSHAALCLKFESLCGLEPGSRLSMTTCAQLT